MKKMKKNKIIKLTILGAVVTSIVGCGGSQYENVKVKDKDKDKNRIHGGVYPLMMHSSSATNVGTVTNAVRATNTPSKSSSVSRGGFGSIGRGFGTFSAGS
jgi:uncharacterized membrane protein